MTTPKQQQARVTRAIRDYRQAVKAGNLQAMQSLNTAYEQTFERLMQELEDAKRGIEKAQAAGKAPNTYRLQRAVELARQAEQLLAEVSTKIGQELPAQTRQASKAAFDAAAGLLDGVMGPPPLDLPNPSSFMTVPKGAIDTISATVNNGPVQELLNRYGEEAGKKAGKLLTGAVAAGLTPQSIAKQLRKALDIAQWQATRIARTEINRAFRESLRETWQENKHLVPSWTWRSGRSHTTCAMCWAMDGREFDTDTPMETHPQCQCCLVPNTIGWDALAASKGVKMPPGDWEIPREPTGAEVFADLPPETQRQILGPGKYKAYADGQITLEDLVHERKSDDWGVTRSEGSLEGALDRSRQRNGGTLPGAASSPQKQIGQQHGGGSPPNVPPIAGTPQGGSNTPVSSYLHPIRDTRAYTDAVGNIIDSVHGVPQLEATDVLIGPLAAVELRPNVNGRLIPTITIPRNAPRPYLSLTHELGHVIDIYADQTHRMFSSKNDPRWQGFRDAIAQSPEFQELERLKTHVDPTVQDVAIYNSKHREYWARAYAQYIGVASGDQTLLDQIAAFDHELVNGVVVPRQWSDVNFAPIGDSIYDLFRTLGWQ